ncbi:MAG: putative toxin-antitoxin system toxin component, PIN family [Saprospirales bacterium]|nr:putative toxin-antitoxin system toxin component, PIN family [Saprospirales bacterium]
MEKVVIDTNVLLVSISDRSRLHWIFANLLAGNFTLCVTTEILAEYAEIIERHMGREVSENTLAAITYLPNVEFVNTYYRFKLLKDDDDNKFVDCAIAASASYIVTHDKDFKILAEIDFPKVRVIGTEEFEMILTKK